MALPMQEFPHDILGKIFEELRGHKSILSDCSLVNREWMILSRVHAFSKLIISHQNARAFLDLLTTPGCTLVAAVRTVTVLLVAGSQKWFTDFSRRLSRVIGLVITTLKLSSSSRLAPVQEEVLGAIPAFYPTLRQLDMGQIVLPSVTDLMDTVLNLRELEGLSCSASFQAELQVGLSSQIRQHNSGPTHWSSPQHRDISPSSPTLQRLALISSSIEYCLGFFVQKNAVAHIKALSLFSLTLGGITVLSSYMTSPHLSLQQLSIRIDNNSVLSGVTTDILLEKLNLASLTMLRNLTIETVPALSPSHAQHLLDSIISTDLASVTFNVALVQGVAAIDISLSNIIRFPSLKRVHILGTAWADARQHLPRCHARKILWSD
ncbi:hypothetical protein BJ165DRAFT_218793 [Panaeolus papilionaceus]|nr:hypothetical protein BJ165DRAFT_218793 [Panaeolus papilionaceus]